jgi:hypothetical protein
MDESPVKRIRNPHVEYTELDRLTDLLHEAVSLDNDGSIEDGLQGLEDEKPRDITRHRKPPWNAEGRTDPRRPYRPQVLERDW